jgi:uncharacterized protein YcbX
MDASEPVGTVEALWRFPVKSMLGEELDAADLSQRGVVGDRAYALRDKQTGKVASAKHAKLWPDLLKCRASFIEPPRAGSEVPPARIDLADGTSVLSDASDADAVLSRFFGRDVELAQRQTMATRSISTTLMSRTTIPKDTRTRSSRPNSAPPSSTSGGFPRLCPRTRSSTFTPSAC